MNFQELWPAFMLGVLGSTHCVGMCGALALSLPGLTPQQPILWTALGYNLGRTFTYSLLGLLGGTLGLGLALSGFQQTISIIFGVLLVLMALVSFSIEHYLVRFNLFQRLNQGVKNSLGKALKSTGKSAPLITGLANGLLPCGLVYTALAGSLTTSSTLAGVVYMALFGLGTLPLMLSLTFAGNGLRPMLRNQLRRIMPVFMFLLGLFIIYRSLGLGLPFSPVIGADGLCH